LGRDGSGLEAAGLVGTAGFFFAPFPLLRILAMIAYPMVLSEQVKSLVVPRTVMEATGRSKISMPMVYSLCAQIGSQTETHSFTDAGLAGSKP
jgi:hypothetical protein